MKVRAQLKNLGISPRKTRLVVSPLVGTTTERALLTLQHGDQAICRQLFKLLSSAVANAENNYGLDRGNLQVLRIEVGDAARLKRWMPRAYGRATPIIKRTCRVEVEIGEIIEGKNRKVPPQLAKMKEFEKISKELSEKVAKHDSTDLKGSGGTKEENIKKSGQISSAAVSTKKQNAWGQKMFRRKSN